jgi:hypothetical protein
MMITTIRHRRSQIKRVNEARDLKSQVTAKSKIASNP